MNLTTIVGHVGGRCKGEFEEQNAWKDAPARSEQIKAVIHEKIEALFAFVDRTNDSRRFDEVERGLVGLIFVLARLFLAYFCACREERSAKEIYRWLSRGYRQRTPERKHLSTYFGRITFWRTYVRKPGGDGLHPLDFALGLTADGFTLLVMQTCARLSTLVSYEQVTALMLYFLSWSPSKTTVEKAVLGFGLHTADWFEAAPPPQGDGEVLVIQVDSKATPTATEEELEKRRGKRNGEAERPPSPRHRGRAKRARRGPKKRRKKGDKSKNGKAATIVVMYTLKKGRDKDGNPILLGPINKRVYASYAPKRHAFAVARREADKRGFAKKSRKTVQIVTDGDEDLERYVKDFFPKARHTLDIIHVLEYFWEVGRFVFKEGSEELTAWVKKQERRLYRGKTVAAVFSLNELDVSQRNEERLDQIRSYLMKRLKMMNYNELRKEDLDVASGVVEGAVRHVIGKRFDSSGMRWIRERAEALLQLRCIELNGDWWAFTDFVAKRLRAESTAQAHAPRLLTATPGSLPAYGVAA